ncbi:putative 2-heptaprenyl-1,4-naphthoquinone methyltransferase [Acrodontium crateriforme]|uniref:2-heptaprenyl-1,4-naphthoquinone methyltransferase n=1 Tax=Acrodontium crateriforme TaxID=150365 RepID=A0AAQ3RBL9_9PEZI|nr:putative 2-heptaprenyl-1,4-naphthoquinone methyltransferase [Acrodontium crateriforme]
MATIGHGGINHRAATGFSKSSAYDQHRPAYSETAVTELLNQTRVAGKKNAQILDLAAGTGKFTVSLAAREEQYEITAVEPHDGMREVLAAKNLKNVAVRAGTAEKLPLDDESVDVVIAAQAFHWFATMPALKEIYRVLKPHGSLGMIWNIEDYNAPRGHKATTSWEAKVQDLTWTFNDNEPRFRHEKWREVFDDQIKSTPMALITASDPLFSLPLGQHVEPFEVWLPKDKIWERYNTISHISVTDGEKREQTYKTFMDALNGPEVEENEKKEVAVHGNTYIVWTTKVPSKGRSSLGGVERIDA